MKKQPVRVRGILLGEGKPKICVPIVGRNEEEILQAAERAAAEEIDLLEWRVDFYSDVLDFERLAELSKKVRVKTGEIPLIFTFRSHVEGGEMEISLAEYEALLEYAAGLDAVDLVDLEGRREGLCAERLVERIKEKGKAVIVSNHHFHRTPADDEIRQIFEELEKTGGDILKLAVMPSSRKDVIRLLAMTEEVDEKTDKPLITMSMGAMGGVSRVSGSLTGSCLTFGAIGACSAPGQLPVPELRMMLALL